MRVRRRIAEWVAKQGRGSQKRLAEAVKGRYGQPRTAAWVTGVLDGPDGGGADLRLQDLDVVARTMGVQPGDLVRYEGHEYAELTATELRLLHHFRVLPEGIRSHFMAYLDYVMDFHNRALLEQAAERERRTAIAREELRRKA